MWDDNATAIFLLSLILEAIPYLISICCWRQICLVNDPRPQNPYGKLYSVEYLGNMVRGRQTVYNNQPIQLLKKAAADSIKDGEVSWNEPRPAHELSRFKHVNTLVF